MKGRRRVESATAYAQPGGPAKARQSRNVRQIWLTGSYTRPPVDDRDRDHGRPWGRSSPAFLLEAIRWLRADGVGDRTEREKGRPRSTYH